jgi:hypothetical protein
MRELKLHSVRVEGGEERFTIRFLGSLLVAAVVPDAAPLVTLHFANIAP